MKGRSSRTSLMPLAFFDQGSSSWRMSQGCLLSEESELLGRLVPWGTTASGVLYERRIPGQLIAVRDGSVLLGTPRSAQGDDRNNNIYLRPLGKPQNLENQIARVLLPTPAVNDMGAGKTIEWWDEWSARQKASDGRPAPHGKSLSIEAQRLTGEECQKLLPTPTQRDYKDTGDLKRTVPDDDSLLPRAIAHHVTGGDTSKRSDGGNKPSDGQHHPQPTLKD